MTVPQNPVATVRHDWTIKEIEALFQLPFNDLLFQAQTVHRQYHDPNAVQISTLLSIKTGACPEDCKYCSQSGHYNTGLEKEKLLEIQKVVTEAKIAKEKGMVTKSGIMLGLGESREEVIEVLEAWREVNVDLVTLGQYMQPTEKHLPVVRWVTPEEFDQLRRFALELGFRFVESGPLVRSSYHASRHRVGAEAHS